MHYVAMAVLMSVTVSVLLKLAPRFRVDVAQAVAWNYLVAALLAVWLLDPAPAAWRGAGVPWVALALLAVLLPGVFLVLAASVRYAGIVRSDAAQRLSLLIPLAAAFLVFGERLTAGKAAGVALGGLALLALLARGGSAPGVAGPPRRLLAVLCPAAVFAGFGVIDVLFKRVAQAGMPLGSALAGLFAVALPLALAWPLLRHWRGVRRLDRRGFAGGVLLGAANFANILFYLKGHRALPAHPALVFAGMNLGVVALGTLVGLALFRERLHALNLAGIGLALAAIGLIAVG